MLALIVDDDGLRGALAFELETCGIAVQPFADAKTALAHGDQGAWRCVVVEQELPEGSALDLLAALRARRVCAPAIIMIAWPSAEVEARARSLGATLVEKPLLDGVLTRQVRRTILQA